MGIFAPLACFLAKLILSIIADSAPAARARQYLPAIPGYIPVYIRAGDTPLEEINPDLAAAFHTYGQKHGRLVYGRSNNIIGDKIDVFVGKSGADEKEKESDLDSLEIDSEETQVSQETTTTKWPQESQHIQKIPRTLIVF